MIQNKMKIMILSDGTGETAKAMIRAISTQFPDKEVLLSTHKNLRDIEQVKSALNEAVINHDLIVYTIVSSELRQFVSEKLSQENIYHIDLMGPMLDVFSKAWNKEPNYSPGLLHVVNAEYHQRIKALEYTLAHDDQNLETFKEADIILLGLSRTSKTPLAVYLSMQGYKVAIYALKPQEEISSHVFQCDQGKIFALTIKAEKLVNIRKNRISDLPKSSSGEYTEIKNINQDLEWARNLFRVNIRWPVIDVTDRSLEDTAGEIIKLLEMRNQNNQKREKRFT